MLKAIVALLWLMVIANLLLELPAAMVMPLYIIGIFMLVAHSAEFIVFRRKIMAKRDGMPKSLLMTLVFGLTYIL